MRIVAIAALALSAGAAPCSAQDERPATAPPRDAARPAALDYGDDSGEWARDGECDDRRFTGSGMALDLGWAQAGRDATDCRRGVEGGLLTLWDERTALGATRCDLIDFGDDGGEGAKDGECDDPRFEGRAAAAVLDDADRGADAGDCRRLCELGVIALRDYRSY